MSSMRRHSSAFVAFNKSLRIACASSELIKGVSTLTDTDSLGGMTGGGMGTGGLILDGVDGDLGDVVDVGEPVRKWERSVKPALA